MSFVLLLVVKGVEVVSCKCQAVERGAVVSVVCS